MALRDLTFKIFAKDNTGKAFDQVEQKLHGVEGAARTVNERVRSAGESMRRFGARASAASAGVVLAFRDSVGAYDRQAAAEAMVRQAIESTGQAAGLTADELFRQAEGLEKLVDVADQDILRSVTAQLLTFEDISGDVFTRAQKLAIDVANNTDDALDSVARRIGETLAAPADGIARLEGEGVRFTETQKAMIEEMVAAGDVAKAQGVILDALAEKYGGQAEAAAAASSGTAALRIAWGRLNEEVGGVIGEALSPLVRMLTSVVRAFSDLDPRLQKFIVTGGALVVAIGPIVGLLGLVAAGFAALGAAGGPIALVVAGIVGLTSAVVAFWDDLRAVWDWISGVFMGGLDRLGGAIERVRGLFRGWGRDADDAADATGRMADQVDADMRRVEDAMEKRGARAARRTRDAFEEMENDVTGNSFVPDMVDAIAHHFGRLRDEMIAPAEDAAGKVSGVFSGLERDVGRSLGRMLSKGKISAETLARDVVGSTRSVRDQAVGDVVDGLGAGLLDKVGLGGSGGSGGSGGLLGGFFSSALSSLGSGLLSGLPGFAQGGTFSAARGRAGVDRNVAAFRVSNDEDVTVTKRGQGDARPVHVTIQTPNPAAFEQSRAQVGRTIGRAVAAGQRGM